MSYLVQRKGTSPLYQRLFDEDALIKSTLDYSALDDSSTINYEKNFNAAKGIIFGLVLCIPFWILFILIFILLVEQ
jgi:hypothetical protein